MREPAHPPTEKPGCAANTLLHPQIAAAGLGETRPQLGVGHRGQRGHQAVEQIHQQQGWAGDAGGDASQHKDAGADHSADTNERDREQTQVAIERNLRCGRIHAWKPFYTIGRFVENAWR